MTDSASLIAEARKLRDHLRQMDSESGEAHLLDRLAAALEHAMKLLQPVEDGLGAPPAGGARPLTNSDLTVLKIGAAVGFSGTANDLADAVIKIIREAQSDEALVRAELRWQPMRTAPADGTSILMTWRRWDGVFLSPVVMHWRDWRKTGWTVSRQFDHPASACADKLACKKPDTEHALWRPLPPPPEAGE